MVDYLQDGFDELIPGAAGKGETFLKVIQERTPQENLGINFMPKQVKKTGQVTLEAEIRLGGTFSKGLPMKLVVHADPVGSSLQVGWQLSEKVSRITESFERGQYQNDKMRMRNRKPENQRKLTGMVMGFHQSVFLPVMGMLVDSQTQQQRGQDGGGFLGA